MQMIEVVASHDGDSHHQIQLAQNSWLHIDNKNSKLKDQDLTLNAIIFLILVII